MSEDRGNIAQTDQRHNEYVGTDANIGRIPGADKATTGHHFISIWPKEGAPKESKGERRPHEHLPPPTGRDQAPTFDDDSEISRQYGQRTDTFGADGKPKKPLAAAPDSITVIDRNPYDPPATAGDTFGGATSQDVHGGIGKPGSGMTSAEVHHDGHHHRKRKMQGTDQYGTGDHLFEDLEG
ncbi:hypothetical protein C8Q75DRAFT_732980 [Abortiporus biennis]|nr:hypothetical protein C8Q75DRAFT_732980 [Abortiporus biennis]